MTKPLTIEEAIKVVSDSNFGYTDDDILLAEVGSVSLCVNLSDTLDTYNNSDGDVPFIEFVKQDLKESLDDAIEELSGLNVKKEVKETQTLYVTVENCYVITIPSDIDMDEHRLRDEEDGLHIVNEETDEVVLSISYDDGSVCKYNDGGVDYYLV